MKVSARTDARFLVLVLYNNSLDLVGRNFDFAVHVDGTRQSHTNESDGRVLAERCVVDVEENKDKQSTSTK